MHDPHFFLSAFIYLATAVLMVPLAHRLGLGSVLGYLIGGAVIGPFALGWVGGSQGEEAMQFAEFGVVIMLFMIGLELEPARLWRMRGPIFGLGGAQVVFTALAVMTVAMLCGQAFKPAIAAGMILALSSTAIVHEQMHSALELGVKALRALGKQREELECAAKKWTAYDEETFHMLIPVHDDDDAYASIVRERRIELTQLFERDRTETTSPSA